VALRSRKIAILLALCLCLQASIAAQQAAFEVASIKPGTDPRHSHTRVAAASIDFSNVTVFECVRRAYGVRPYQLIGPKWINTESYTIAARAASPAPEDQILLMVRTLLAERFGLVIHHEARPTPVYALVVVKNGPKLKQATDEGETKLGPSPDGREMIYERESIPHLALRLQRWMDRPVIDETGLKGVYNFRLNAENRDRPGSPGAPDPDDLRQSIFADIQDRLGLKLEPKKAPIDVLVIDHIEKPSGN
jgi:uncharacterized protein (TIGR03435 family)